jgi:SAM-dependent methyltransferase
VISAEYLGEKPKSVLGPIVYFESFQIKVGEESNGIKVLATNAPWSVKLGYKGGEYEVVLWTRYKEDFFKFVPTHQYDCIICNGVLHHMPKYKDAIDKIKTMIAPSGRLILGVYNYYGKSIKKIFPITYRSELLRTDQEDVPYEINFTNKEFLNYFKEFKINTIHPSINNQLVDITNLMNYANGGLTVYSLTREPI